jgi:hypothetical protein
MRRIHLSDLMDMGRVILCGVPAHRRLEKSA